MKAYKESLLYDYPTEPVPKEKRRSLLNLSFVTAGLAVAMSTLYTGASLANLLTFRDAVWAIILGSLFCYLWPELWEGSVRIPASLFRSFSACFWTFRLEDSRFGMGCKSNRVVCIPDRFFWANNAYHVSKCIFVFDPCRYRLGRSFDDDYRNCRL